MSSAALSILFACLVLSVDGAVDEDSLRQEIEDADSNAVIFIESSEIKLTRSIDLGSKNVTLRGATSSGKTTVVCSSKKREAFYLKESARLENLDFTNCRSRVLTIEVDKPGQEVFINSCSFRDNKLKLKDDRMTGGAIAIECSDKCLESPVYLRISESEFRDNFADRGGAVYGLNSIIEVSESVFENNQANYGGAAIYARQDDGRFSVNVSLAVQFTRFKENKLLKVGLVPEITDSQGKALEIVKYHSIEAPLATGGAIHVRDVRHFSLRNSTLDTNEAPAGGTLSVIHDFTKVQHEAQPSLNMASCNFTSNKATHSRGNVYNGIHEVRLGGAIYFALGITEMSLRIEDSVFVNNEAYFGGAMHIAGSNSLACSIANSSFISNRANLAGGAAFVRYIGILELDEVNTTNNVAQQGGAFFLANHAGLRGGGLKRGYNTTKGTKSHFVGNIASYGGAIACTRCGNVMLQDPHFEGNRASRYGGAVYVLDHSQNFLLFHLTAISNRAMVGGVIAAESAGRVGFDKDSRFGDVLNLFVNNSAAVGGAVCYISGRQGSHSLYVYESNFTDNKAAEVDSFSDLRRLESSIEELKSNVPFDQVTTIACGEGGGGAICLDLSDIHSSASVDAVVEETSFADNSAAVGGISLISQVSLIQKVDSGALYVSIPGGIWNSEGSKVCAGRTSVSEGCRRFQFIKSVNFTDNEATEGGGAIFVTDPDNIGCLCDNTTNEIYNLTEVVLKLTGLANSTYSEVNCTSFKGNNVVKHKGVYGPDVATRAFSLAMVHPNEPVLRHPSGDFLVCDGELKKDCEGYVIRVVDRFNQTITGGIRQTDMEINVKSESVNGNLRYTGKEGRINVNKIKGIASKESREDQKYHEIEFEAVDSPNLSIQTNFTFRKCVAGEIRDDFVCRPCQENYYSFDPLRECLPCEDHAECRGNASLVPEAGYWHSTPLSPRFHLCLVHEACDYADRNESLSVFHENPNRVTNFLNESPENFSNIPEYEQCREGYTGVLCGSCDDGYGRISDRTCSRCGSNKTATFVLLTFLSLWITILVGFEIFNTMHTNKNCKERNKELRKDSSLASMSASGSRRSRKRPGSSSTSHRLSKMSSAESLFQSRESVFSGNFERLQSVDLLNEIPEHIASSEKLTETVKIFINFLQITSVAVSMNLRWHEIFRQILRVEGTPFSMHHRSPNSQCVAEVAATVTNGATYMPLECTFGNYFGVLPPSMVALWIRIAFPFLLLGIFLLVGSGYWSVTLRKQKKRGVPEDERYTLTDLKSYFLVAAIAVSFFAYKDVTEDLMRTVSCIKLENENTCTGPACNPYSFYSVATERYWAEDTTQICWEGNHLITAVFGTIGLIFFSLGNVLFTFFVLAFNENNLGNEEFIAKYGFLYRAYKPYWYTIPWEAVIAIRKALVSAAVVFAFPLGPNLQVVMTLGVLLLAQAFHLMCWPFKEYPASTNVPDYSFSFLCDEWQKKWVDFNNRITMNHLESASLLVSTATFYAGIVFYDNKTAEEAKAVLTGFVVLMNVCYLFYMVYRIYALIHVITIAMVDKVGERSQLDFSKGPGVLRLIRRIVQLSIFYYRDIRRSQQIMDERIEMIRQSASMGTVVVHE